MELFFLKHKRGLAFVPFLNQKKEYKEIFSIENKHFENDKLNKIYLMFNPRNRLTKIGRSKSPKAREKTLQGEDPETELIAIWMAPQQIEKDLHDTFQHKRIRGEWFKLSYSELLEIDQIMQNQ